MKIILKGSKYQECECERCSTTLEYDKHDIYWTKKIIKGNNSHYSDVFRDIERFNILVKCPICGYPILLNKHDSVILNKSILK